VAATVMVRLRAKPGQGDALIEVVNVIGPETRAGEGAGPFELLRDLDDPDTVIMVEHWRDRADHEAYAEWRRRTGAGMAEMEAVLGAPPEIWYLETIAEW
jgi:quinol monooxygenase YgiN